MRCKLIIFALTIIFAIDGVCQTQVEMNSLPIISSVNYSINREGEQIRYHFPDTVIKCIEAAIVKNNADGYFIYYKEKNDTSIIVLHSRNISLDKKVTATDRLLSSTNRFCVAGNEIIPIYFQSDIKWTYAKFVIVGGLLYVEFDINHVFLISNN